MTNATRAMALARHVRHAIAVKAVFHARAVTLVAIAVLLVMPVMDARDVIRAKVPAIHVTYVIRAKHV